MNNFCYIHIPFCTSKCKYCRFASFGILDKMKIDIYVKYLLIEIKNKKTDFKNLKSVYFGGGTPSTLNIVQFNLILLELKNNYGFDENIEINIEATPITITEENLLGWKKLGINRLSMGIQTLNNQSLIEIGRGNKGDIINALNIINKVGFNNVSLDFIIGLPYVKKGEIKQNIEFILNKFNFIKHISVYMLEEYYEVTKEKDSKFENIVYPNNWNKLGIKDDEYLEEYSGIVKKLEEYGFNKYEISNFSKNGYNCKHNSAYWNHSNMLAFGLGAHGFLDNTRYSNSEDFLEYYFGKNIINEKLSNNDIFLEKIMFDLRTTGLENDYMNKLDKKKINYFIENGYLKNNNNKIILLDKGVMIQDYILKEII